MLAEVCRALAGRLDEQAVVDIVCKYARQLIGADGACVIVREGELVHYACEDAIAPLWQGQQFPISNCISGWSILHDAPAIIEDIYADDRIPADYYRSTFVNSLAMMPIHADNPIGAIGVYWRQKLKAGERQLELLERLADIAGIALTNAQLFAREQETRRMAETAS